VTLSRASLTGSALQRLNLHRTTQTEKSRTYLRGLIRTRTHEAYVRIEGSECLKPGIDCARLPREAIFVALPRKVDTMLPSSNLARVEPNRGGSLTRGKGISVCYALSVETRRSCGVPVFLSWQNGE
jgi:hypothetical protein